MSMRVQELPRNPVGAALTPHASEATAAVGLADWLIQIRLHHEEKGRQLLRRRQASEIDLESSADLRHLQADGAHKFVGACSVVAEIGGGSSAPSPKLLRNE